MSTTLETITPVVGTNPTIQNINFNVTDWLEVKNDSPFAITVSVLGVSQNSFFLSPFEHNGWPIQQLLQTSQLQVKNLSVTITPSHYYSNVATENNSPTNIVTVSILSAQEAQTNTYPLYTARMNTTVATIANTLTNIGNASPTVIVFIQPLGDSNSSGTFSLNNTGLMTLGDTSNPAEILLTALDNDQMQLFGDLLQMFNGVALAIALDNTNGIILANNLPLVTRDNANTNHTTLFQDALNEIILKASVANNILFEDKNGTTLATIDGNGIHLNAGSLAFLTGSISRHVYTHIASVTTTAAFVNHNLGVTPDYCILIPNDGVLSAGNFNAYYESSSMTNTQVKLQSNSAGGIPVGLIAIKL